MRKGMEKPIEIFVALFVILAVIIALLPMFKTEITSSDSEMFSDSMCKQKCLDASNKGCSLQSLAALCMASQNIGEGYDTSLFGGVGVCKDNVPCFNMIDSCCARKITPESCVQILDQFWNSKNYDDAQKAELCSSSIGTGSCSGDEFAWWNFEAYQNLCS